MQAPRDDAGDRIGASAAFAKGGGKGKRRLPRVGSGGYAFGMPDEVVVIFTSERTGEDAPGYAAASQAMDMLARAQPGFIAMESVRGADGFGITVSTWVSEADAVAWRAHVEHAAIREAGRARWYRRYEVTVARVERRYAWRKAGDDGASLRQKKAGIPKGAGPKS